MRFRITALLLLATLFVGCRSELTSLILGSSCTTQGTCVESRRGQTPALGVLTLQSAAMINFAQQENFSLDGTCPIEGEQVIVSGDAAGISLCETHSFHFDLDFRQAEDGVVTLRLRHSYLPVQFYSVTKDTKNPLVAWDPTGAPNIENSASFAISGTCDEARRNVVISGVRAAEVECMDGKFATSFDLSTNSDGLLQFKADLVDAAGNASAPTILTITKDTVAPLASFKETPTNATQLASFRFKVGAVEPISYQYVRVSIVETCQTASYNGIWIPDTIPITGSVGGEGTYRMCVRARDQAGNSQPAATASEFVWTYDTTVPTVSISTHGFINSHNQESFTFTGSCSESGQRVNIQGAVTAQTTCQNEIFQVQLDLRSVADGTVSLTASHQDAAGNQAVPATITLTKDALGLPVPQSSSVTARTGDSFVYLNWQEALDNTTSTADLRYAIYQSTQDNIDTLSHIELRGTLVQDYAAFQDSLLLKNLVFDRDYWFNIIVRDGAGNKIPYRSIGIHTSKVQLSSSVETDSLVDSSQRKTIFDPVNKTYWAFFRKGGTIHYASSNNLVSWQDEGDTGFDAARFAISSLTVAGQTFVLIAFESTDHDVSLRRGTIDPHGIGFDGNSALVFDGSSSSDHFENPSLALDDQGHAWVSAVYENGSTGINSLIKIRRSSFAANDSLNQWDAASTLGSASDAIRQQVLVSRGGQELMLVSNASQVTAWRFNGTAWSEANSGGRGGWLNFPITPADGASESIDALTFYNGDLIVAGNFTFVTSQGTSLSSIARWDGNNWQSLGTGMDNRVRALTSSGSYLYAAGEFTVAGDQSALRIARWNGTIWEAMGTGLDNTAFSLASDHSGQIYVGGAFNSAGGVSSTSRIAKWDGTNWNALSSGVNNTVTALAIDTDDSVYAGGYFTVAGGRSANRVAKWQSSRNDWINLGSGINDGLVNALALDSKGQLYAGGSFTLVANLSRPRIAKWNGTSWSSLGVGMDGAVKALSCDASGNVYAAGSFAQAGTVTASNIARWSGSAWEALERGLGGAGSALLFDASSSTVYITGPFETTGGFPAQKLATWRPSAVAAGKSGGISLVADPQTAKVSLLLSDQAGLKAYHYLSGAWTSPASLSEASTSGAALSLDATSGDLWASWIESQVLKRSHYQNGSWSAAIAASEFGILVDKLISHPKIEADPFAHVLTIFQTSDQNSKDLYIRSSY